MKTANQPHGNGPRWQIVAVQDQEKAAFERLQLNYIERANLIFRLLPNETHINENKLVGFGAPRLCITGKGTRRLLSTG